MDHGDGPFNITIGKCAVIEDPFGTRLCILDMTKGARPLNLAGSTTKGSDGMSFPPVAESCPMRHYV